jgi:hypothetical protein
MWCAAKWRFEVLNRTLRFEYHTDAVGRVADGVDAIANFVI